MLVILNEATYEKILENFKEYSFFGFSPSNVYFMVQNSYHGIDIREGRLFYNDSSQPRLHNHGQMAMQTGIEGSVFFLKNGETKTLLSRTDFGETLRSVEHKISYPIEDIDYLNGKVYDYPSIALALELGEHGYRMVMEITGQKNPPQKGGFWAYDPSLDRGVMIESDAALGIRPEEIQLLNKNFNQFPHPYDVWSELIENSLPLHLTVKSVEDDQGAPIDLIFPQPVQGDQNFLVPTAFIQRDQPGAIRNLKNLIDVPDTLRAMYDQEKQAGFIAFVASLMARKKIIVDQREE